MSMTELPPSYFFDLSTYQHVALFDEKAPVWKTLKRLDPYLSEQALGAIEVEIPNGVHLIDAHLVSIGKGTVVEPGAYIKGPCVIGQNCSIRHGAYIRGNVVTGSECVIGHDTEVKHSILLNGVHAAHFAYLGDSIIGSQVNLGAGVKCANLKLDASNVAVYLDDQTMDTGLRKFGAIIGDDSQVGCNTVTNPGTLLGKKVFCYPLLNIGGVVPSYSIVKNKTRLWSIHGKRL